MRQCSSSQMYIIYFAFRIPMFGLEFQMPHARQQFPQPFIAWQVNFHLQSELGSWLGTSTVTFGSQVCLLKHLEWCHFVRFESCFAVGATYLLFNSVQFNADAQMLSWIHGLLMVAFWDRQSGTKLSTTCLVLCWAHFSTPYPNRPYSALLDRPESKDPRAVAFRSFQHSNISGSLTRLHKDYTVTRFAFMWAHFVIGLEGDGNLVENCCVFGASNVPSRTDLAKMQAQLKEHFLKFG